jgi:uncharacterized protein with PIN domain
MTTTKNQQQAQTWAQEAYDNLNHAEAKLAAVQEEYDKALAAMENELQRCKDCGVEFEPQDGVDEDFPF